MIGADGRKMIGAVGVVKAPECGYIVLGTGTYCVGAKVDVFQSDEDEVRRLLKDGYVEWVIFPIDEVG
jgi:hypothetical protein